MSSSSKKNPPPSFVRDQVAEMQATYPEFVRDDDQFTPKVLEQITPDRIVIMDWDKMHFPAREDGSEHAELNAAIISQHLAVLAKAHNQFSLRPRLYRESNLDFERLYHELYQDILLHQDEWFDLVFRVEPKNPERCIGILGALATILRQRGDVNECLEVMKLDSKILEYYQDVSSKPNAPPGQVR